MEVTVLETWGESDKINIIIIEKQGENSGLQCVWALYW